MTNTSGQFIVNRRKTFSLKNGWNSGERSVQTDLCQLSYVPPFVFSSHPVSYFRLSPLCLPVFPVRVITCSSLHVLNLCLVKFFDLSFCVSLDLDFNHHPRHHGSVVFSTTDVLQLNLLIWSFVNLEQSRPVYHWTTYGNSHSHSLSV